MPRHYYIRSERAIPSRPERSTSPGGAAELRSAVVSLRPGRALRGPRLTPKTRALQRPPSSSSCRDLRRTGWRTTAARTRPSSPIVPPSSRGTGRSSAGRSWTASSSPGRRQLAASEDEAVRTRRRTTRWPNWTATDNWTAVASHWLLERIRSTSSSSSTWLAGSGTTPVRTQPRCVLAARQPLFSVILSRSIYLSMYVCPRYSLPQSAGKPAHAWRGVSINSVQPGYGCTWYVFHRTVRVSVIMSPIIIYPPLRRYNDRHRRMRSSSASQKTLPTCLFILQCKTVVTCEIKLIWNNVEIISVFVSRVTRSETEMKLFRSLKEFWNYFKIISVTLNMLENIRELQLASELFWNNFRQVSTRWNKSISDRHRWRLK